MVKKQKNISWTPVIITAMVLGFLLILFFVDSNFNTQTSEYPKTVKYNKESMGTNNIQYEIITISGTNNVNTINEPDKEITLIISGIGNIITISKETEVTRITLSGQNNQINLCKNIHSPELIHSGLNNNVNYLDC